MSGYEIEQHIPSRIGKKDTVKKASAELTVSSNSANKPWIWKWGVR